METPLLNPNTTKSDPPYDQANMPVDSSDEELEN